MAKFEFGFEEAWLRLIIKKIPNHPNLFLPSAVEQAQTILRVGKLKVGAARAWAEAAGVIIKKKKQFILTPLGNLIKHHDPDMDDDGIWWALHYNLARQNSPAWFYAFYCNEFTSDIFDRGMLEKELRAWWDRGHEKPMTDSIFDKLVFSPLKQAFDGTRLGNEFGFFALQEGSRFCRQAPGHRLPPAAIVAYGLLDWARQQQRQSVHLEKLLGAWGIGRIFRLDRTSLDEILIQIGDKYNKQVGWVSHTAGLNSVSIMDLPPLTLISAHYYELDGESPSSALEKGKAEVLELGKMQADLPLFS
ncbi:MAG: DUF4007 family protein [Proteobacteria bacterium]|nr:DUF4007 family protein [Pseudomonadota bacterium]MBU4294908.1 DUF4007 family protein [Pseudomonadota bacterium]MCG2747336.1 DUF4007 family protein [Desulfobulbaceae bacterium]